MMRNIFCRARGAAATASLVVATVALSMAASACGGGDDDEEPTATVVAPTSEAGKTPAAEATPATGTLKIDRAFWHAGWKVTLGTASLEGDVLSIQAEFENLGDRAATFDSQLVLQSAGNIYDDPTAQQELPEVPGQLKGTGLITFRVDDTFDLEDAVLTVGNPSNNQAAVPLGTEDSGYVSLEPRAIEVTGSIAAGALTITVEGAEVRADLPDLHSEVEKGKKAITVRFSAMPATGIAVGQGVLFAENVILKLPDGTAVAVRSDGVSGVSELLQGREGTTISGLKVRYEIPDPVEGQYALVLRGKYGPGGADAEGQLPFSIAAASGTSVTPTTGGGGGPAPTSAIATPITGGEQ